MQALIHTTEGSPIDFELPEPLEFDSEANPGLDALSRPTPSSNATITAFEETANFVLSKNNESAVTLLAPKNSAFNKLTSEEQDAILNDTNKLKEVCA